MKLNPLIKNIIFVILILLSLGAIFSLFYIPGEKSNQISLSKLVEDINSEKVKKITVSGQNIEITYKDDSGAQSMKESNSVLPELLINIGVNQSRLSQLEISAEPEKENVWNWLLPALLYGILPLLLIGFFLWTMLKQTRSGAMQMFDFTRSKARIFGADPNNKERVTFKDVAGLKEAKEELVEIVDFLKFPKKYIAMGAKIPRGVLLVGGAGVGKTLLARAVAGEANVPFFSISGSEFVEMFVGVGASVAGNTNVLIKTMGKTRLMPISEFIDAFYEKEQEGLKSVEGVQTLGANFSSGGKFFTSSEWKKVRGVYRHKVNELYTVKFLGGAVKTTGDHSVFVRNKNRVVCKKTSEIKPGDILVALPFKVRSVFKQGMGTTHKVKNTLFAQQDNLVTLPIWEDSPEVFSGYQYALKSKGVLYQHDIAEKVGVSQMTVSLWQRGLVFSRLLSKKASPSKANIPSNIEVTPELLKILGYYTAEGRTMEYCIEFVFGIHEKDLHQDCIDLMRRIFYLEPRIEETADHSLRIQYFSKPLATFFTKSCGNGSHHKHIPEFLWDLSKKHFLAYLQGYSDGDGFISKEKHLSMSSVSKQLILELSWLCAMHNIQASMARSVAKAGRTIVGKKKLLPETISWTLKIGKTANPFIDFDGFPNQFKKPIVQEVIKESHNGYVYDLCGCDNEAFFGGQARPILLHNSRVRDLFGTAKKASPSIVFIDELDAIGRHRGAGIGGGHDEREQTLNMILVEMDGFEKETGVIILAATNRPDILDPALLRPGRFDRKIILDPPDVHDREAILKIHSKEKPLADNIHFKEIAERTPGFSGADLANVANEAALMAARQNKNKVFQKDFLEAIEKVLLGPERKSHILSKKEKEIAAYHEAGHALVASSIPGTEPIRKISIISRGMAAGYTLHVPSEENKMRTKTQFMAEIATLFGGFAAERLKFGEMTTGAANDLVKASELARKIVKEYGMSSLGPISFGDKDELVFLGREISEQRNYSEAVAEKIDKEIENIIKEAEKGAMEIVRKKKALLEKIARTLIEKETIEREEFEKIIGKKNLKNGKSVAEKRGNPRRITRKK